AVEEAALDVASEVSAAVHHREETTLDERDRERERQIRIGWESRDVRRCVEAAGVDREQEEWEHDRRHDLSGLANGAHQRPPRELCNARERLGLHRSAAAVRARSPF